MNCLDNINWINKTIYLHKFILMDPVEFLWHDISESYHNSTRCHIVINSLDLKFYDTVRHKLPVRHAHVDLVNTNVKGLNGLWMKNYRFMRNEIYNTSLIAIQYYNETSMLEPLDWYIIIVVHSLWPNDAIWQLKSGLTLAQVVACCLTAPSHYLNQYWLLIREVLWHSPGRNFTVSVQATILYNEFENYTYKN